MSGSTEGLPALPPKWSAPLTEPPAATVYREGDPPPGRRLHVLDREGDISEVDGRYGDWAHVVRDYGPLVEVQVPDYDAAVEADEQRRRAGERG